MIHARVRTSYPGSVQYNDHAAHHTSTYTLCRHAVTPTYYSSAKSNWYPYPYPQPYLSGVGIVRRTPHNLPPSPSSSLLYRYKHMLSLAYLHRIWLVKMFTCLRLPSSYLSRGYSIFDTSTSGRSWIFLVYLDGPSTSNEDAHSPCIHKARNT